MPGAVPVNASSLYARNLQAFVEPLIDKEKKTLAINFDDELVKGTLIARDGVIVNGMIAERLGGAKAQNASPAKSAANGTAKANAKKDGSKRQTKGGKS
jgi:NAD(P) transhydrogenase subunit alpha